MVAAQRDVLRAYLALREQREDWHSRILFIENLDSRGCTYAMAGVIAGAVVLSLTDDADTARQALRTGCCDFIVNTLDEALRILKNEVRKGTSVSVALVCQSQSAIAEMKERGVIADATMSAADMDLEWVCTAFAFLAERDDFDRNALLDASEADKRWINAASVFFPRDLERWYRA